MLLGVGAARALGTEVPLLQAIIFFVNLAEGLSGDILLVELDQPRGQYNLIRGQSIFDPAGSTL